jgi:thiamine biosynthesis protein ThiI
MHCIINGESIGQVASQTLHSMLVVNEVTNVPIIRPLATYDKEEIVKIARKIGTYDISIRPYEDCCTVFVPKHPVIKPSINEIVEEENKCELDNLIIEAFENIKKVSIGTNSHINAFDLDEEKDKFTI